MNHDGSRQESASKRNQSWLNLAYDKSPSNLVNNAPQFNPVAVRKSLWLHSQAAWQV